MEKEKETKDRWCEMCKNGEHGRCRNYVCFPSCLCTEHELKK